ncbi:MAG: NlpC/P60 family protein [Eubacteriales bacterium]|nr:NlpC/P60 family protein [Eubacteriales bacterium]
MRRKLAGLAAFFMAFFIAIPSVPVYAERTREEVQQEQEQKKQEQQNTQSQYKATQGMLDDLQEEQDVLQEEIDQLDAELVEVIASVALMEEQIAQTQEQIVKAQEDYDAAKAQEEAQYQAMKRRIKYLYEKGETTYMELLMHASDWSSMLNQAAYVEKLYEYDKKMLNQYIAIKEEVEVKKGELEDKKSELEAQKYEMEEEKAYMEEAMEKKKAISADYDAQIAKVKQEAAAYKAKIKQQNAELQALQEEENAIIKAEEERRRKEEEARKAAEEKNNAENNSSSNSSSASGSSSTSSSGGLKTVPPATGSSGADIAQYACQFVGNPYVAGGTSLTNGADCSGFVMAVYKQFGYNLPRNSTAQRSAGREVSYADAQPGDIICYAGHVAIYLGGGRIVHASTERTGIKYGYANYKPIITVRRIVG